MCAFTFLFRRLAPDEASDTPSPVQDMKHLSMKVGDRVDIVAFHEKWWLARNAQDGAGRQ
jgi:hypothetical protein